MDVLKHFLKSLWHFSVISRAVADSICINGIILAIAEIFLAFAYLILESAELSCS